MMTPNDYERKIIVIDDNPNIHRDFKTILDHDEKAYHLIDQLASDFFENKVPVRKNPEKITYSLDFALQGKEGVGMVKTAYDTDKPYMVAFVDMRIPPGLNGIETIKAITEIDPRVQLVLCTAFSDYSFSEIKEEVGDTTNLLILKKPFDASEIQQLASTLTEKWMLSREARMTEEELNRLIQERTQKLTLANQALELEIIERKRAEESIKILTQENLRIQETERRRIACDLHDSVAQDLAALLIKHELMLDGLRNGAIEDVMVEVRKSICILKATIHNVRNISYNLRPPSLSEFGIVHALRLLSTTFFEDDDINVTFETSFQKSRRFDDTTEINLYRILQESLTNIRNHANPENVYISLTETSDHTVLTIRDDGIGFNKENRLKNAIQERRMGLKGIEERVNLIKGEFEIISIPSKGTEIVVRISNSGERRDG